MTVHCVNKKELEAETWYSVISTDELSTSTKRFGSTLVEIA